MLTKDDGVVLKTARSGETSLLVTLLSRKSGKIRLMAKGVLSSQHPSRGALQAGSHVEVVFYFKENRSVYYLRETTLLSAPFAKRDSLPHLAARLAAMELLEMVCYPGSADETIVDLAVEHGRTGPEGDPLVLFLAFELKLLVALGSFPELSGCARCGSGLAGGVYGARDGVGFCPVHAREAADTQDTLPLSAETLAAIVSCAEPPLSEAARAEVSRQTRKQLGKIVHSTYTFHVQGYSLPKSLSLI
jgi:DNA repair protein RecO (recombination protein O)